MAVARLLIVDESPVLVEEIASWLEERFSQRIDVVGHSDYRRAYEGVLEDANSGVDYDIVVTSLDAEPGAPGTGGSWFIARLAHAGALADVVVRSRGEADVFYAALERSVSACLDRKTIVHASLEIEARRRARLVQGIRATRTGPRESLERSAAAYAGKPLDHRVGRHHLPLLDGDGEILESGRSELIGFGPLWQEVLRKIARPRLDTVFLEAPSGSGKTTLARYIHQNSSYRGGEFLHYNGGMLRGRLAIELNGWKNGSFTHCLGENRGIRSLDGGCVFVDEFFGLAPEDMKPLNTIITNRQIVQHGANRALDVNVQLIFADIRDLEREREEGHLPPDLFNRLRPNRLLVPSVEQTPYCVPPFICRFLETALRQSGFDPTTLALDLDALLALSRLGWTDLHTLRSEMRGLAHAVCRLPPAGDDRRREATLDYLFLLAEEEWSMSLQDLEAASRAGRSTLPASIRRISASLLARGFRRETVAEIEAILSGARKHLRVNQLTVPVGDELQLETDLGILEILEVLYLLAPNWSDPAWFGRFLAGNTPDNMRRLFDGDHHPLKGLISAASLRARLGAVRRDVREQLRRELAELGQPEVSAAG